MSEYRKLENPVPSRFKGETGKGPRKKGPVKKGDTVTVRASEKTIFRVFVEDIIERSDEKHIQGKIVGIDPIYPRELKDWDLDGKNKIEFSELYIEIES